MATLALSTDSLHGYGLNRIFQIAKQAGFDAIDLAIDQKNHDTQNTEYVKKLSEQNGIPVCSIQTPMNATAKTILNAVEMAKELHTKVIAIQPPKLLSFKFIRWIKSEIPKIRQREDLSIALENAPSDMFLGIIPEHAMQSLSDLKNFKHVALDTSRVAYKNEDLIRVYNVLKKFLVHIHLSNYRKGKGYALPEEGALPLESLLTKLRQDGYKGAISFKVHPKFLKAGNDSAVLKKLGECKKFYEKYFVNVSA